jgi:hypothetical protein
MAECPFCFTQLDNRAVVCSGCGARKGYGYHSSYGVLTAENVRSRLRKFRIAQIVIALLAVISFLAVAREDGLGSAIPIALVGAIILAIPTIGRTIWKRRIEQSEAKWWK